MNTWLPLTHVKTSETGSSTTKTTETTETARMSRAQSERARNFAFHPPCALGDPDVSCCSPDSRHDRGGSSSFAACFCASAQAPSLLRLRVELSFLISICQLRSDTFERITAILLAHGKVSASIRSPSLYQSLSVSPNLARQTLALCLDTIGRWRAPINQILCTTIISSSILLSVADILPGHLRGGCAHAYTRGVCSLA